MEEDYEEELAGTPNDLHELYMTARAETFLTNNFYKLYLKTLFLIDIGKEMLPETEDCIILRKLAVMLLEDIKSYPSASQMEHTDHGSYRISTGQQDTGLIEVREEDLEQGRDEAREQKATRLLPRLKKMDSKIFEKLVYYGIVEAKKPSMEELMRQDVLSDLQAGKFKKEEEVKESHTKISETAPAPK